MVRIKVEYDKRTRTFKLVDPASGVVLHDHNEYELLVPLKLEGVPEEENLILVRTMPLAHA
jgi:hypothetical protein